MDFSLIQASILGAVQGITEFIPISSSGHLIWIRDLLNIPDQGNFFDAILHLATLLAIIIYFRLDWSNMIKSWTNGNKASRQTRIYRQLSKLILIATVPAVIVGWFFNVWIEQNFRGVVTVAVLMILTGIVFMLTEKLLKPNDNLNRLNWPKSLGVGLAQVIAILPGISRSGATIVTGMYMGLKRDVAARFSFLLAAPIIAVAGGYSLILSFKEGIIFYDWLFWLVAFGCSLLFGILSIKFLLNFLKKYSLNIFAYYLLIVGVILLVTKFI